MNVREPAQRLDARPRVSFADFADQHDRPLRVHVGEFVHEREVDLLVADRAHEADPRPRQDGEILGHEGHG